MRVIFVQTMVCLLLLIGWGVLTWPDDRLQIVVCDVGQGDAILIQRAFLQVLVDGGPGDQVLNCLHRHMPIGDKTIEGIVLSHPQADHLSGLIQVLARYQVRNFFSSSATNSTEQYYLLQKKLAAENQLQQFQVQRGKSLQWGPMVLNFLWPTSDMIKSNVLDVNESSVVFSLNYRGFSMLFTGDIGKETEQALLDDGVLSKYLVLKAAHHGSKHSNSMGFLQSVLPEDTMVSSGSQNRFGHPHSQTLDRLSRAGTQVWRTDQHGDILIVSDGYSYQINPQNQTQINH